MILSFTISCEKDTANYKILTTHYLENKDLFNCVTCFSIGNIHAYSGFVINDNETYKIYVDSMRIHPLNSNCDTATLIKIDFKKYTLIGIMTEHSSCDLISKEITADNKNKMLSYIINIKEGNEPCDYLLHLPLNLVLISKMPENYQVEFKVNRH
jgi:hypothetical protein